MEENERKLSIPIYLAALAITVAIFLFGIYIGNAIAVSATNSTAAEVQKLSDQAVATQLFFLLDDSADFCPFYSEQLSNLDYNTELIGQKLTVLEEKGTVDKELKNHYFLLETEAYLLSKKIASKCGMDSSLALYFYSNRQCNECAVQGRDLLEAKKELKSIGKELKIYSFDGDLDSPIANSLKAKYNVTVYPTVIIGEVAYGQLPRDDIVKIVSK